MRNCDTCKHFVKYNFQDGRKGLCRIYDFTIEQMKNKKPCKKYKRESFKKRDGGRKTLKDLQEDTNAICKYIRTGDKKLIKERGIKFKSVL